MLVQALFQDSVLPQDFQLAQLQTTTFCTNIPPKYYFEITRLTNNWPKQQQHLHIYGELTLGTWQPLAHLHDGRPWLVPACVARWFLRAVPHTLQDAVLDALCLAGGCTLHMHTSMHAKDEQMLMLDDTVHSWRWTDGHSQLFPSSFRHTQ